MNLLNNLDEKYKEIISSGPNYDSNYFYYSDVKIKNSYSSNSFLCLKQKKVKFLIIEEKDNIRLYLTDADIINLIINLELELYNILIKSFYEIYKNNGENFIFTINDIEYNTFGLKFSDEEKMLNFNIQLETKADFNINFEDLVNIINLILAKEGFAMEISNDSKFDRLKRQLAKYISLSEFYRNSDEKSLNYLKEIDYDFQQKNIFNVYKNEFFQNRLDSKFDEIKVFEKYFISDKISIGES